MPIITLWFNGNGWGERDLRGDCSVLCVSTVVVETGTPTRNL
jgi:hypothetical protein